MEPFVVALLVAILASVSSVAGALIGAHFDRVYTGALVGLLLGPVGVLWTLCAAGATLINPRDPRVSANYSFVLGPVGLLIAWYLSPGR